MYFGEDEICEFELLEDYSKNVFKFLSRVRGLHTECTSFYVLCMQWHVACVSVYKLFTLPDMCLST